MTVLDILFSPLFKSGFRFSKKQTPKPRSTLQVSKILTKRKNETDIVSHLFSFTGLVRLNFFVLLRYCKDLYDGGVFDLNPRVSFSSSVSVSIPIRLNLKDGGGFGDVVIRNPNL